MIGKTREARIYYAAALRLAVELAKVAQSDQVDILLANAIMVAEEQEPPRDPKVKVEFKMRENSSDEQLSA